MGNYSRATRFKGIGLMQGQSLDDGAAPASDPLEDPAAPAETTQPPAAPERPTAEAAPAEAEGPSVDPDPVAAQAPAVAPNSPERGSEASATGPDETTKDTVSSPSPSESSDASAPKHRRSTAADTQDDEPDVQDSAGQITREGDAAPQPQEPGDASPSGDGASPKAKRSRSRRQKQDGDAAGSAEKPREPATLVELLVMMSGAKGRGPTKKIVKGAKPTEGISPDDIAAIRAAVARESDFSTPVAFLLAVLLSTPSRRAVQQALDIAEQCLIAHHLERATADTGTAPDQSTGDWLVGWLTRIIREASGAPGTRRNPEVDNLVRTLVVLLSARGKVPPETAPALLLAVDGRAVLENQPSEPTETQLAMHAMGFAMLLHGDQLSHEALIAAAVHGERAKMRARHAEVRASDLQRRSEQAEQLSRRLAEEAAQTHAAVVEAEAARDEIRRELSNLRQESKGWREESEGLKAAIAEIERRSAEERERSEQRRIDDSNAYEALRAATSRSRRKDLELLAEAAAALEKDPPKPHVAADRIALVLRSMERERESLRSPDERPPDPEGAG